MTDDLKRCGRCEGEVNMCFGKRVEIAGVGGRRKKEEAKQEREKEVCANLVTL